jgi:hypothetical protein
MSRGSALLVREETEWLDVDYLDGLEDVPADATEAVLATLVPNATLVRDLAAKIDNSDPRVHLIGVQDVRMVMSATSFVPDQEFRVADYLDDED